MPVAGSNSFGLFGLALTHTGLQSVVDTRCVGNDKRWAWISLGLADSLESLGLVGTHCNLSHVNVAVGGCHEAKVFLADALTLGCKLSNCA